MRRIIAIGDLHGCNDAFQKMLFNDLKISKQDKIFCIGDYIDRGMQSKEVIDTIISLRDKGFTIYTLRGNHEQMMMDSEETEEHFKHWLTNGGDTTLQSFDVNRYSAMPEKYKQFFQKTKLYHSTTNYVFVHAGLNFTRDNIFEDKEAMLWTRNFDSEQPALKNKILIHGHTPKPLNYILNQPGNCINIDGGCVYTEKIIYGHLVAITLPAKKFTVVPNYD